jgi:zona occludens toxin
MSIYAYVGMPRSGKSYSAVENQILPAVKAGRKVVTNIPLNRDAWDKLGIPNVQQLLVDFPLSRVKGDPDTIYEYVTPGCLFVLDEVWNLWPSGEKVNKVPDAYKKLLAEHGHMVDEKGDSMQIVLVVQDLGNIGAFAQRLVEMTFVHTKLTMVGMSGTFRTDIYQGPVKGPQYPVTSRQRDMLGQYRPEIYDLYKSHMYSKAATAGANEKNVDKRAVIWRRPAFMFGIPVCVGLLWFGGHLLNGVMAKAQGRSVAAASAGASGAQHGSSALLDSGSHISPPPVAAPPAPRYRVVGLVANEAHPERSLAVLSDGSKFPFSVPLSRCRDADDGKQCQVDGVWFGSRGAVASPEDAVKIWTQGSPQKAAAAVSESKHVELEVLPPAKGDPVEGSEQLRMLARNSAGLDDRGRPAGTFRGVAGR